MPVTFKSVDPYDIIEQYDTGLAQKLKEAGISFKVGLKEVAMLDAAGHLTGAFLAVTPSKLKAIAEGKATGGPGFVEWCRDAYNTMVASGKATPAPKSTVDLLVNQSATSGSVAVATTAVLSASPQEAMAMAPVKLRDASVLYQPVFGTDQGSRYFTVAISDGIKVAARWKGKGGKLSIRVEGSKLSDVASALASQGFDASYGPDNTLSHMSIHVTPEEQVLAGRTLGAALCGMGLTFDTPLPNIAVIAGKGS